MHNNDHTIKEYKDKLGRVILKRTYDQNIPHDTYYVYDDFGNLTYVIPPKVNTADGVDQTELDELCYQYLYDYRNRLVEKKIPGKGREFIIYNRLDQPILTQDLVQRPVKEWLFTKYDAFGRVVYTGLYEYPIVTTRAGLQNNINDAVGAVQFETKQTTAASIAGTNVYYSNAAFPDGDIQAIYTINYYDNYTFDHNVTNPGTVYGQTVDTNAKGMVTGTKVRVLDTNDWITTVTYYDDKGRAIYIHSTNTYLNTVDVVETKFDFAGKVLESKTTHTKNSNAPIVTVDTFEYDHMGRLLNQKQTINNQDTEQIVANTYDELGQLVSKKVGGAVTPSGVEGLQQVDYSYNIRGWLKQINNPDVMGNDLFAFGINYNTTTQGLNASALYNGNISGTIWKTANDNAERSYGYQYDALNRITDAKGNVFHYDLSNITYDKNGNILTLVRDGHTNDQATEFGPMDDLIYEYNAGNKLLKVTDYEISQGFKDGNTSGNDYLYDANGNLIKDLNKDITGIMYNHLNLPTKITFNINGINHTIDYTYTADGTKISKKINEYPNLSITEYAGNFIYKSSYSQGLPPGPNNSEETMLQFFNHPERYIEPDGSGGYDYIYQYKDHLGNIRLSYADDNDDGVISITTEIREEKNYYPFGLEHKGYNNTIVGQKQPYGYNGQEFAEELGLNLSEMTFRQYDPAIGRFNVIDPLAEEAVEYTSYRFGFNNPIYFSDPTGLWERTKDVYKTTDKDEIMRLMGYINQEGSYITQNGILGFIKEDIAFMKSFNEGFVLSTALVKNGKITDHSILKMENEISYYQGYTDYLYDDVLMRNKVLAGDGDPIRYELIRREALGWYQPVTAKNYIDYIGSEKKHD